MKKEDIQFAEKLTYKTFKDLEGQVYGQWLVIGFGGRYKSRPETKQANTFWWCECSCFLKTVKQVRAHDLKSGDSTSCGCYQIEVTIKNHSIHGMWGTPEYSCYLSAKGRCQNSNNQAYKDYGERGIKFNFVNFEEFYAEVGDKPEPKKNFSIDRINNNGHYEKGNVKWALMYEQNRNKRNNDFISWNNETKCLADWAESQNVDKCTLWSRIYESNYCINCALTNTRFEPCMHKNLNLK